MKLAPKVELPILPRLHEQGVVLNSLQGVPMPVDPTVDKGNALMSKLGMAFRRWCKRNKVEKPPQTWNMHLVGRSETNTVYPNLDSNVKAAHTKPILFFLAEVAKEISDNCDCAWFANEEICSECFLLLNCFLCDRVLSQPPSSTFSGSGCSLRALALWGSCEFLWVTDRPALYLGRSLADKAYHAGTVALRSYSKLSSRCLQSERLNYKLRPKWHLGIF